MMYTTQIPLKDKTVQLLIITSNGSEALETSLCLDTSFVMMPRLLWSGTTWRTGLIHRFCGPNQGNSPSMVLRPKPRNPQQVMSKTKSTIPLEDITTWRDSPWFWGQTGQTLNVDSWTTSHLVPLRLQDLSHSCCNRRIWLRSSSSRVLLLFRVLCRPSMTLVGLLGSLGPSLLAFTLNLSFHLHLVSSITMSHPIPTHHDPKDTTVLNLFYANTPTQCT